MYQKIITVSMSSPKTICFHHFNLFSENSTHSTKSAMVWFLLTQLFWTYEFLNIKLYYFLFFLFLCSSNFKSDFTSLTTLLQIPLGFLVQFYTLQRIYWWCFISLFNKLKTIMIYLLSQGYMFLHDCLV